MPAIGVSGTLDEVLSISQIVQLYKDGWSSHNIGRKLGIPSNEVNIYLRGAGILKGLYSYRPQTAIDSTAPEIEERLISGEKQAAIAREIGVSRQWVNQVAMRLWKKVRDE